VNAAVAPVSTIISTESVSKQALFDEDSVLKAQSNALGNAILYNLFKVCEEISSLEK
jgi:hypothetical protein